ncbi:MULTISPECIES: hypothetical protein [unclassified Roseibium]|uniref:hypothetical protein n=1 Tax=unclassified Roseibium TaxID=2629323 RepID=UPI00273D6784|nr:MULTISPECIES: hypothetical protein [unclassified Roseibium]
MAGKNLRLGNAKNRFGAYTGQYFYYADYAKTRYRHLVIAFAAVAVRFDPAMANESFCS